MFLHPRMVARKNGDKTYMGIPCPHNHIGKRYTRNGECVECRRIAQIVRNQNKPKKQIGRPRKFPDFIGPPKPRKKHSPKPISDFEFWVQRSRVKNKERRQIPYEHYKSLYTTHCPLLGIELTYKNHGIYKMPKNYATLDKIDPDKGYVVGNVQILSSRANTIKNDSNIDELKMLIENWDKQLKI